MAIEFLEKLRAKKTKQAETEAASNDSRWSAMVIALADGTKPGESEIDDLLSRTGRVLDELERDVQALLQRRAWVAQLGDEAEVADKLAKLANAVQAERTRVEAAQREFVQKTQREYQMESSRLQQRLGEIQRARRALIEGCPRPEAVQQFSAALEKVATIQGQLTRAQMALGCGVHDGQGVTWHISQLDRKLEAFPDNSRLREELRQHKASLPAHEERIGTLTKELADAQVELAAAEIEIVKP